MLKSTTSERAPEAGRATCRRVRGCGSGRVQSGGKQKRSVMKTESKRGRDVLGCGIRGADPAPHLPGQGRWAASYSGTPDRRPTSAP